MGDKIYHLSTGTTRSANTFTLSIVLACFIFLCDQSFQFGFQPRLITRFCYNSPNLSSINSQCVLCNYYMFDGTLLGCTGSTALNVNITSGQAFCVISQCLGQVRQSPVFLGRRKRSSNDEQNDLYNDNEMDDEDVDSYWKAPSDNSTENGKYSIVKQVDADIVDDQMDEDDDQLDNEDLDEYDQ